MIEVRQVQQFVHKPEAVDVDRLPYQDGTTGRLSYKTIAEFLAWLQTKDIGLTQEQVQALLSDYLHKNGAAFQTVSTGQGVMLESTGAFEADAITWGQYFDPYELTTHRERRNSSNALVSGFYGNRFKEKGWQGVGLFLGVMPTGVTQETEWEYSYDTLVSGNKTTYSGHFVSDTKSGLFLVTHDGATTTTFEFSDAFYVNGQPFSANYTGATSEAASPVLNFTNPFGHIRTAPLTGAQTFTKAGYSLGSTIVQAYTATGSGALTFPAGHTVLNSDFESGQVLAAGEYKLFFSNWGDTIAVTIATVDATPVPNSAPTSNAGADQSITLPTNSVTLSGSGTDSDGTIASYAWSKVSGGTATITSPTAASTTVTGLVEGVYVFRLTVTDNEGATATDDITITVNAAGGDTTPPSAPDNLLFSNITQTTATAGWDAPIDTDVAGYNLYLNGVKQN